MTAAIAVVIPTHNRSELLTRAIDSVRAQTFTDWELVVVDDGSSDDTASLLANLTEPRIKSIFNSQPLGAAGARNAGIQASAAPLIAFLDDDDEYFPNFLDEVVAGMAAAPEAGLCWVGTRWVQDEGSEQTFIRDDIWTPVYPSRDAAYRGFLRNRRVGTNCGLVVRRTALDKIGLFDDTLESAEDTEFLIRAVREFDFVALPKPLVTVHEHGGERLRASPAKAQAYAKIVQMHNAALESDPDLWADVHYKTAWLHYHAGDRRRGRRFLLSGLRRRPWHIKSLVGLPIFEIFGKRAPDVHRSASAAWRRIRPGSAHS